ncbi:MAG: ABC transporter ATP-binding protein [Anaerolineaceae bacterium]|nr:ABC transporter ATP-binding protein [Anaerolineaceae bacterium]
MVMPETHPAPDIEVHNLTFHYPDGHPALRDVGFSIAPGQKVALVGANGSGKSTLLLLLNGVLRASAGTISICGLPLSDKTIPQIRAWVGLVFQNPDDQLFSPRVYDDVAFAARYMGLPEPAVQERVAHALEQVGMAAYADRVSYHLSVGEKKRIALATVLTMDTRILALDEPSAGLDPRARRDLMQRLKTFAQQTLFISTHDMRLAAELCSHAIVLNAGEIVANGPAETILYDRELMERHGLETPE